MLLLRSQFVPASSSSSSSSSSFSYKNFPPPCLLHQHPPTLSLRVLLVFAIIITISDNLSYTSKYREISGVVRTVGQIPCPINSMEDVSMILWFKDGSGSPIYSYDARNEKEPRHLTLKNDWGLRLYFRVWPSSRRSPALMIRELEPADAGYYRCRVDYKNSPTSNSIIRLKIIQPPTLLEVQDISQFRLMSDQKMMPAGGGPGQPVNPNLNDITYMGPYLEGQAKITIVCTAYGGKPAPEVLWLWHENGKEMVDTSYEVMDGNFVSNQLNIVNLTRHTQDLYTCVASNSNDTKITHRVNLDIYLTPKHIELDIPDTMIAKTSYKLACHTIGAYPSVKMEFSKVQKRIGAKYQIKADADNGTTYTILFQPEIEDDEEIVYCRAENPWIVGPYVETRKKLRVYYPPVVVIRFGSSKTTNFSEGESILLECHVKSNPPLKKISWYHQGNLLEENVANGNGIVIKGFTLLIRQLVFRFAGEWRCQAENEFGKGSSDNLRIVVNISPRCADDLADGGGNGGGQQGKIIPLALGQSRQLECNIQAWPPDLNFYWTLQRTREILSIPSTGNTRNVGQISKIVSSPSPYTKDFNGTMTMTVPVTPTTTTAIPFYSIQNSKIGKNSSKMSSPFPSTEENDQSSYSSHTVETQAGGFVVGTEETNVDTNNNNDDVGTKNYSQVISDKTDDESEKQYEDFHVKYDNDDIDGSGGRSDDDGQFKLQPVSSPTVGRGRRESISQFFGTSSSSSSSSSSSNQHKNFQHESTLPYTIFDENSYGIVACWAKNSFGQQLRPCYFHIVPPEQSDRGQQEAAAAAAVAAAAGGAVETVNAMVVEKVEEEEEDEMESEKASQSTGKRVKNLKTKEGEQQQQHRQTYGKLQEKVKKERRNGYWENGEKGEKEEEEEKADQEEVRPLSSKLRGTLGITIILMGVLIFIGCFTGAVSWLLLLCWRRQRRKNSEQSAPPTPAAVSAGGGASDDDDSVTSTPPSKTTTTLIPPTPPQTGLLSPSIDDHDGGAGGEEKANKICAKLPTIRLSPTGGRGGGGSGGSRCHEDKVFP